jgi:hypothetical protein
LSRRFRFSKKWTSFSLEISRFWFLATFLIWKQVLGRNNRILVLIRHGPHWKRRVQQNVYCCVCIRYRGKVSTEPLPSNGRRIFTEPRCCLPTIGGYAYRHRLMGGIF